MPVSKSQENQEALTFLLSSINEKLNSKSSQETFWLKVLTTVSTIALTGAVTLVVYIVKKNFEHDANITANQKSIQLIDSKIGEMNTILKQVNNTLIQYSIDSSKIQDIRNQIKDHEQRLDKLEKR